MVQLVQLRFMIVVTPIEVEKNVVVILILNLILQNVILLGCQDAVHMVNGDVLFQVVLIILLIVLKVMFALKIRANYFVCVDKH